MHLESLGTLGLLEGGSRGRRVPDGCQSGSGPRRTPAELIAIAIAGVPWPRGAPEM